MRQFKLGLTCPLKMLFIIASFSYAGNTTHVEEEFTKLRQENQYLRSKLLKAEQEIESVKVAHITIKVSFVFVILICEFI